MNRNAFRKRPATLLVILVYAFGPSTGLLAPAHTWAQAASDKPVEKGEGYYEQSRFDEAISLLKDLVTNNSLSGPDLERAREILARSYVKKGYPVQAKEMFKEILRANPDWRPDPIRVPPDEAAIFDQALKEFQSGVATPTPSPATGTTTPTPAENAPPITTSMDTKSSKKGLFSKWYFYAGLAAVGAGAALALGGGGGSDDGGGGVEPLPDFPNHP